MPSERKVRKMNSYKLLLFSILSLCAFVSFAKTCTWTGGAGTANWTDAENWDWKEVPAVGDTVVFDSQGELTVDCPTLWVKYRPAEMRFLSGVVTLNTGSDNIFSMETKVNTIDVAKGAKAVIVLNYKDGFRVFEPGYSFFKTGEGELVFKGLEGQTNYFDWVSNGATGYWKSRELVSVDSGTMTLDANGGFFYFCSTNIIVKTGAKLSFVGNFGLQDYTKITGGGDIYVSDSVDTSLKTLSGSKICISGWLVASEGGKLLLGDNFDYTKASGRLKGIRAEESGTVQFNLEEFSNIEIPVRGSGTYEVSATAGAKFTDLRLEGAQALLLRSECEIAGGDVSVKEMQTNASGKRSALTRISGGRIYNGASKGAKETDTDIKSPDGIKTTGSIGSTSLEITGGDVYWLKGNSIRDIFLRGGVFRPDSGAVRNLSANQVADSAPPYQLVFDGGTAHLYAKSGDVFQFFKFNEANDRADTTVIYVTDKGGRIIAQKPNGQTGDYTFITTNAFVTCTNTAVSGALVFSGWGDFVFGAPMDLNGPVEFRDGTAIVTGPQLAGNKTPFGTGDLRLRNARLFCDERSGAGHGIGAINLASGTGSAIVYEGSCEIATREVNDNTAVKAVVANAIRRAGAGAALYLRDGVKTSALCPRVGDTGFSTVKLVNAPQIDERTGLLKEPVFIGSLLGEFLATYDAQKGFVPHDTLYNHAIANLVDLNDTMVFSPEAGTTHELAANAEAHIAAASLGNFAKIILYKDAKLKVGNGVDPAVLLLGVCGKFQGMEGTIDFGTSEGVISCNNCTDVPDSNNSIACKINGSNGVSYVSDPDMKRDRRLELHCANPYSGATHISAVRIGARHEGCFSAGDVHVLGGEASGGAIVFKKNATWANTFHIAGHGYHDLSVNSSRGCLEFMENATISGDVEIAEEASVNVRAGYTGVISGEISGDRLKLYRSEGLLKLTGENTYTGGTCVARSTLAVSKPTGLGTGAVLLDGGSVVFDNVETMSVANDWDGVGTVCVTGAEVRFAGAIKTGTITLDFPNNITLSEIPPFAKITNSSTRASTLTLAAKEGVYELDPSVIQGVFNLVLEDGASLDLGGKTLIVRRFEGDRASVNGVISETNPKKGVYILVR